MTPGTDSNNKIQWRLLLAPASWLALLFFYGIVSSPIRPELADSLDPKDFNCYFILEILLVAMPFVTLLIVFNIYLQLVFFKLHDRKSILPTALFALFSVGFIWLAFFNGYGGFLGYVLD